MAKRESEEDHERMVGIVAASLEGEGYTDVRADHPSYHTPEQITRTGTGEGSSPDVTAEKEFTSIFEVETEDSITDEHTKEQWKLFAEFAQQTSSAFCVVVPEGSKDAAQTRLNELGIKANVWGI